MKNIFVLIFFCTFFMSSYGQKLEYTTITIPDSLKQGANAVVRLNQLDITISSQRNMSIKTKRVITVLNEKGLNAIDAVENYDKTTSVRSINAIVYNAYGTKIKEFKKKDFGDHSAVGGGTMFSESRVLYLDYTPIDYPFTIEYESERTTSNTAFIPQWRPLDNYYVSVEKSVLNVNYPSILGFKKKELNFGHYPIKKEIDTPTQLSYVTTNLVAAKIEEYSPVSDVFPRVMLGLESFHLEGVDGNAKTWKEFGQWYSEKILAETTELSEETIAKIKALVGDEKDPIKKAKIIYNYVQEKSRYVSIQVGIGGWKPMLAKDVDRLGYGDCKALTNYTKALLNVVDVPSYNTVLYGDRNKRNIVNDFVSMQGNHMILSIPNGQDYIWLECTSQDDPFGYQGIFTDDRDVLIMKPDGGEIVRTKVYTDTDNAQTTTGSYTLSDTGELSGSVSIVSQGSQYSKKFGIEKMSPEDKETHYKDYWDNINNLKINKTVFSNDKEKVAFTENIQISAANYGNMTGKVMLFVANAFNKSSYNIKKVRNRKNAFEIQRGYYDVDQIDVNLPQNFDIEAISNNVELKTKFGEYKIEFVKKDDKHITYKRTLLLKKGLYNSSEYEDFRAFTEQITRNDNAKIILIKK